MDLLVKQNETGASRTKILKPRALQTAASLLCYLVVAWGCTPVLSPIADGDLSKALRIAAELQSASEQWVQSLKRRQMELLKEPQKNAELLLKFNKAEALYIEAAAAFNGWITGLQVAIVGGFEIQKSDEFKQTLEQARTKARNFLSDASELIPAPSNVVLFGGLLEEILKADFLLKLLQEVTKLDNERRDKISTLLDKLKWKNWADLKAQSMLSPFHPQNALPMREA